MNNLYYNYGLQVTAYSIDCTDFYKLDYGLLEHKDSLYPQT